MIRSHRSIVCFAGVAAVACLAACSWGRFDDLKDTTFVDTSSAPSGISSGQYGVAIGATATEGAGISITVLGDFPASISTVGYDASGSRSSRGVQLPIDAAQDALVVADADSQIGGPDGVVAIGVPGQGQVLLYTAGRGVQDPTAVVDLDGTECSAAVGNAAGLGSALAIGAGDAGTADDPDLVVATNPGPIVVYSDLNTAGVRCSSCALTRDTAFAVAFADVTAAPGEEIILAQGNVMRAGRESSIDIFSLSHVVDNNAGDCFPPTGPEPPGLISIVSPVMEQGDFGDSITVGNFDGGGIDIVATAPSANLVYVLFNVSATGAETIVAIDAPTGSGRFGEHVAAGDFDDDGFDELAVAAPGSNPEGNTNAGSVYIYTFAGQEPDDAPFQLYDAEPETDQLFGQGLVVGQFDTGAAVRDILIVGADKEVFTYFRTPPSGEDVRVR